MPTDAEQPRSEAEWAAYFQAHKDDPDWLEQWDFEQSVPPRPRGRPSQGLDIQLAVRFTPEDAAILRAVAEQTGQTYSEIVRQAVRALQPSTQTEPRSA
jgi:hypothetical protein